MENELFPYQIVGAKWLASRTQALLADEMGLGKSAQAVHACDLINAKSVLVICPAAVRVNWSREFVRFSDTPWPVNIIMSGNDRPLEHHINICSYDILASNEKIRRACRVWRWDAVIMDEAHYMKERLAKRTKAVYGWGAHVCIADFADRMWRLTGTPAPNDASELYTHLKSAGIEKRGYWDFVYEFCSGFDSNYGFKITGHQNVEKLKEMMAQFMLRRKKDQVLTELPRISFAHVTVERSEVELDPYFFEQWHAVGIPAFLTELGQVDKAAKLAFAALGTSLKSTGDDALAIMKGLSKSTATLRRYLGLAKLPRTLEILKEELDANPKLKIVVFAVHKDVIESARLALTKYHAVTLYGNTPDKKRQHNIDRFQRDPSCRVFIGNIQAAGTGITLTAANEVVFAESSWVPSDNAQAAMRCHRIGQTRPVRVRFFSCAGSVDEDVMRTLVHKTRELAKIFD